MLVECAECTAAYPPDVPCCPNCSTPNHVLRALEFTTQDDDTTESVEEPPATTRRSRKTETVQLPAASGEDE